MSEEGRLSGDRSNERLLGFAAALFGVSALVLLLVAAQPLREHATSPASSAESAAYQDPQGSHRKKRPCQQIVTREESELCGQWEEASAARDAVVWAERQFWIGVLTSLGLGLTIILTYKATRAAELSVSHFQAVSSRQLRAYVGYRSVSFKRLDAERWRFEITYINSGITPATVVASRLSGRPTDYPLSQRAVDGLREFNTPQPTPTLVPAVERRSWYDLTIPLNLVHDINAGQKVVLIKYFLSYHTVFGERVVEEPVIYIVQRIENDIGWPRRLQPQDLLP